jgi:hypothetical protein
MTRCSRRSVLVWYFIAHIYHSMFFLDFNYYLINISMAMDLPQTLTGFYLRQVRIVRDRTT